MDAEQRTIRKCFKVFLQLRMVSMPYRISASNMRLGQDNVRGNRHCDIGLGRPEVRVRGNEFYNLFGVSVVT